MDYSKKKAQAVARATEGGYVASHKLDIPYPADGDRWGNWRFDAKQLDLVFEENGREQYAVDLEDMDSCAKMADWIFQVNMKVWATREDIGNLIQALDDLLRPQGNLCSGGADKRINSAEFIRSHMKSGKAAGKSA